MSGAPGAGKTSVCQALQKRFPRGIWLSTDHLRWELVGGTAWYDEGPGVEEPEAEQSALHRQATGQMAAIFSDAGYAVAIDDTLIDIDARIEPYQKALGERPLVKVLLAPSLDETLRRNASRETKSLEDRGALAPAIAEVREALVQANTAAKGWRALDTTGWSAEETVEALVDLRT